MASAPFHGFFKALSAELDISEVISEFMVFAATSAAVAPVAVSCVTYALNARYLKLSTSKAART